MNTIFVILILNSLSLIFIVVLIVLFAGAVRNEHDNIYSKLSTLHNLLDSEKKHKILPDLEKPDLEK